MWTAHLLFHCRVFAIKYRTIPCNQPIANEAKQVGKLAADPHANQKPAGLKCSSQVTRCNQLLALRLSFADRYSSTVQSNQRRKRIAGCAYHSQQAQSGAAAPSAGICDARRAL